jgi:hypothetical protein
MEGAYYFAFVAKIAKPLRYVVIEKEMLTLYKSNGGVRC